MARDIRLGFETLKSLANGSIGASYTIVGSTFTHPIRILIVNNGTNAALLFSFDGVNDTFYLGASASQTFYISSNKVTDDGLFLPIGSGVYVKQSGTPNSGSVYVSAFYGAPNS